MGSSASLDRSSKKNYVEESGGLPPYVREIARSIEKGGKTLSAAIAIAISRIRVWAAGKGVTAKTQAKASAALADYNAMLAKNKTRKVAATGLTLGELDTLSLSASVSPELDAALRLAFDAGVFDPGLLALSRIELAASKHTRTDGKTSNDPAGAKEFPSDEWKTAPKGMKCSRWQHGDNPPQAVAYRTVNGKKLGACASHKREMSKS